MFSQNPAPAEFRYDILLEDADGRDLRLESVRDLSAARERLPCSPPNIRARGFSFETASQKLSLPIQKTASSPLSFSCTSLSRYSLSFFLTSPLFLAIIRQV